MEPMLIQQMRSTAHLWCLQLYSVTMMWQWWLSLYLFFCESNFFVSQETMRAAAEAVIIGIDSSSCGYWQALIADGSEVNATDDGDSTALILAASEGRSSVVQALISAGQMLICSFFHTRCPASRVSACITCNNPHLFPAAGCAAYCCCAASFSIRAQLLCIWEF